MNKHQSYKHYIKLSQMNSLKMIGESFQQFSNQNLRTYIRTIYHLQFIKELKESINLMMDIISKKKPLQMVKILIFIHITLQQTLTTNKIIMNTINKVLNILNEYKCIVKSDSNNCFVNSFNWFKEKFIDTEKKKKIKKSLSSKSLILNLESQILQTKEQFLIDKIIRPYLAYLVKYVVIFPFIQKSYKGEKLQISELWSILNILSYLFEISKNFDKICRYYGAQYRLTIQSLALILNRQIQILYGIIKTTFQDKRLLIKKSYNKYKKMMEDKNQVMKILIQNYPIDEMYKIIQEIGKVNQNVLNVNSSKYYEIKSKQILNILMRVQTPHYDFIQKIYKHKHKIQIQKQKDNPKQQLLLTIIPTLPDDQNYKKIPYFYQNYPKNNKFKNIRKKIINYSQQNI